MAMEDFAVYLLVMSPLYVFLNLTARKGEIRIRRLRLSRKRFALLSTTFSVVLTYAIIADVIPVLKAQAEFPIVLVLVTSLSSMPLFGLLHYRIYERRALRDLGLGSPAHQTKVRHDVLLPTELKYKGRFETIALFRLGHVDLPFDKALQEYHREPIHFALALAELNAEVFTTASASRPRAVSIFLRALRARRRRRDVIGHEVDEYLYEDMTGMSIPRHYRYLKAHLIRIGEARIEKQPEPQDTESLAQWELQLQNLYDNVRVFCKHTGSEVDDLAPPRETINNLRKHASNRRQELAPLLEENARLNRERIRYKRINAALQTRHTIEKLVFELPPTKQYSQVGSGPKWQNLWKHIWTDAEKNPNNPFHKLFISSTGEYAKKNIKNKGRELFADMSGEIHGYDLNHPNTFDYEHFDASARKVAMVLHEDQIIDQETGDVDWGREIRKYPVTWPKAGKGGK